MAAYAKTEIFYISVWFCLILGVECDLDLIDHILAVQTGGSVTIPCHYDEKYIQQKKYWYSENYNIYRNTTQENLSITDHPDQSLFTVTMRNLQYEDTGHYSCIVDEQGQLAAIYRLYISVQSGKRFCNYINHNLMSSNVSNILNDVCLCSAPDVSVVSSSVSGHEGGDISVQCLYSSGYKNEPKQWCRYKDQSCYTVGRTDRSQNSSVQISDDGRRSFTVLMTGLRLADSGWYFCSMAHGAFLSGTELKKNFPHQPERCEK
ncbi:hypothetical protein QQF64_034485 [Cirrhinus molitorella]|uniref:Ig-like domain-containing protein n=1 Tax=Cirrhinus molitorella TaxID=172907 RepID=A0ABR3L5H4_9TELE